MAWGLFEGFFWPEEGRRPSEGQKNPKHWPKAFKKLKGWRLKLWKMLKKTGQITKQAWIFESEQRLHIYVLLSVNTIFLIKDIFSSGLTFHMIRAIISTLFNWKILKSFWRNSQKNISIFFFRISLLFVRVWNRKKKIKIRFL